MILYSATTNGFYRADQRALYERSGSWPTDLVEMTVDEQEEYYMQAPPAGHVLGADANGRPCWVDIPPAPLADLAQRKCDDLEAGRKASEKTGITFNGIRYAGDPSNRQALMEALDLADTTGQATFASWKDSDDRFHTDHPVADVRQALHDIAARRGQLIAREGELNAQVDAALEAEDRAALEAIEWSEAQ